MASRNGPGTLERKIHFFRAEVGTEESGQPLPFNPIPALNAIEAVAVYQRH